MAFMSQRQYAKHRGVAESAVRKAIKSGRITPEGDGRIESKQADTDWEANTISPRAAPRDEDEPGQFGASQYTKARAVREHYQARLAKIEYEERIGKLVNADEVQVAAFNKFRQYRDAMLGIPDRVAAMCAAETDAARVHEILTTEIRKVLNDFADTSHA